MLAFYVNGRGACDAERSMREQIRHFFVQGLRRFDIKCQKALLHVVVTPTLGR